MSGAVFVQFFSWETTSFAAANAIAIAVRRIKHNAKRKMTISSLSFMSYIVLESCLFYIFHSLT